MLGACTRLHEDVGLSARHITVSTVGVVPGMERLAAFDLPVTLAVSLHAPDDALREQLVPLNRRYPIADVLDAARAYADRKGRRVTFEYACIDGVNDAPDQADVLAARLAGMRGGAHVNLIPLNATSGYGGHAAVPDRIEAFAPPPAGAGSGGERSPQSRHQHRRRLRSTSRPIAPASDGHRKIRENDPVNEHRWFNPHQPQTLQSAVILCYIEAVFGLLFGVASRSVIVALFIIVGLAAGGFGIANEKKWGYGLAVAAAVAQVLALLALFGASTFTTFGPLFSFMFDAALVALLLHPMSRDYQRIWFR